MGIFDNFIGLYPVQKTLRFELKPQEETKKFLKLSEDFLRAEYYPKLKKILDDYYRYFIEQVLSTININEYCDIDDCFNLYNVAKNERTTQAKKNYTQKTVIISKKISDLLKVRCKEYQIDEYNKLLKQGSKLFMWLNGLLSSDKITQLEYDESIKAINAYNRYVTCLQGFQNNRTNIFEQDKSTSIAFRTIENMERYFENCNNYNKLISKYNDINAIFENTTGYFAPKNYYKCIAQSQIDKYNEAIGHSAEEINAKGVNQKLNEYAQSHGLKRRDVPMMSVLYKQILSDRQTFAIETIENDKMMISLINEANEKFFEKVKNIKKIVDDNIGANTFITTKNMSDISQKLFGGDNGWAVLGSALRLYCENNKIKGDNYKYFVTIGELQKAVDEYAKETGIDRVDVSNYFNSFSLDEISSCRKEYLPIKELSEISNDRQAPSSSQKEGEGYGQVQRIKNLLDAYIEALHIYKPLCLVVKGKSMIPQENDAVFYNQFAYEYEQLGEIIPLYNKVRNYLNTVTKIDKTKIRNFLGSSSLLNGWSVTGVKGDCYIFNNCGQYYLAEILDNSGIDKAEINKADGDTWKVDYFLQKLDAKNFPRVFILAKTFEQRAKEYENFSKVKFIYENKLYLRSAPIAEADYKKNLIDMIDYFKYALMKHESYNMMKFSFKNSDEYQNIQEFYHDAMKYSYIIKRVPSNFAYLKQLEKENKILLFHIYNKDFSQKKKNVGTPNLHTMYLKELFSDDNLQRIDSGKPFIQLNGGAQIYTRPKSIECKVTHVKNIPIENKNPLNEKKSSVFKYDLIKDRRFSEEKMFLHFPITLNGGTEPIRDKAFNEFVNKFLRGNKDINIIGLDRGERHLLYYVVIDRQGNILEQGSFNTLTSEYNGGIKNTDYHSLLNSKEIARDIARKTWGKIEAIALLKEGYLSNVVHKLTQLMIKYNAIIVLENLNKGMKNSRIKVEKQVYQKFEHAIINKLNYLVFKNNSSETIGGALNGYQLTNKLEKYEDIGKQNGFLFYIDPAYTSKIDPKTGFVNMLRPEYLSVEKGKDYFLLFDDISSNNTNNYFEFSFDYDKFGDYIVKRKKWTVCSFGVRYTFSTKTQQYICVDVTKELMQLFDEYGIDYANGNLKEAIASIDKKEFFVRLIYLFKLILQLRNTVGGDEDKNDYILSPVKGENGEFFDTRKAQNSEPRNADANGAYHIALKGLWNVEHISENGDYIDCSREDWFKYRQ